VSKTARSRIEELERRQWEAQWSAVLSQFPHLTAYQLGRALHSARLWCGFPASSVNLESLSRGIASLADSFKLLHSMTPDIPAFMLRYTVDLISICDGATDAEWEILFAGGRPARLVPFIKAADDEYQRSRRALGV
jgi:hypothetical protein